MLYTEDYCHHLFTALDQGFCTIEVQFDERRRAVDYRFLEVNAAFEQQTGLRDAVGRQMRELAPAHEEHWFRLYGEVALTGVPVRFEQGAAALNRWYDVYAFRVGDPALHHVAILFSDITLKRRAQLVAEQNEARLRRMINVRGVSVLLFRDDGTLLDANDEFFRTFGYSRDAVASHTLTWRAMTPSEHVAVSEEQLRQLLRTGRIGPYEKEYQRRDGSRAWMLFAGASLGDGTVVEYCIDITDRRRVEAALRKSEAREAFLLRLSDALTPLTDAPGIEETATRMLREQLDAGRVVYTEFERGHATIRRDYAPGLASMPGIYPQAAFGRACLAAHAGGEMFVVDDVRADPRLDESERAACTRAGIAAFVSAGSVKGGVLIAALAAHSTSARKWFPAETSLLREVGERTWEALRRAQAERAVRESEERLRVLTRNLPGGAVFVVDRDLRYLIAEGEALTSAGFAAEPFVGRTIYEALTPELAAEYAPFYRGAFAGRPFAYEHQAHGRTYITRGTPLRPGGQEVTSVLAVSYDITDRKKAEAALRESDERLHLLLESVHDYAIFSLDIQGRITSWNEGACRLKGYRAEEILGQPVTRFYTAEDVAADKPGKEMRQALTSGRSEDESWRVRKDGSRFWVNEIMTPLRSPDGAHVGFTKISRDLTERRRAEERLRASEERLRLIVESADEYAIFTIDLEGRIESWNVGAERIFGWAEDEAIGRHTRMIFTPEDVASGAAEGEMRIAREEGRAADERWHITKSGRRFYASGVLTALRPDGVLTGFAKIARDLTVSKQLEDAQRRTHDELERRVRERTSALAEANATLAAEVAERRIAEGQVKALFKRVIAVQEAERRRIARDIHDQLGQPMTALRMSLEVARRSSDDPALEAEISRTEQLAGEVDQSIDFLTWDLRPAALDHVGLSAALANLVKGWSERFGIEAEFDASGPAGVRLAPDAEANLYRLTQEALHNILKHAAATHASVLLEAREEEVVLVIEDDGRGFDVGAHMSQANGGLGLVTMRERASLFGGVLTIQSAPEQGTAIFVRLPILQTTQQDRSPA